MDSIKQYVNSFGFIIFNLFSSRRLRFEQTLPVVFIISLNKTELNQYD